MQTNQNNFTSFHFPNLEKIHIILSSSSLDLQLNAPNREQELTKIIRDQENLESIFETIQVHTDQVIYTDNYQQAELDINKKYLEADGLATQQKNQGLMIKTADCQAILLAHSSQKYILALHVGWKGNKIRFIQSAIQDFCQHYSIQASELYALRTASLGPKQAKFTNFAQEWGFEFSKYYQADSQNMDLWTLTQDQLLQAGLKTENIFSIDECTYSMPEKYHSYRRDKSPKRLASIIWIA